MRINKIIVFLFIVFFIQCTSAFSQTQEGMVAKVEFSNIKENFRNTPFLKKYIGLTLEVTALHLSSDIAYSSDGITNTIPLDIVEYIEAVGSRRDMAILNIKLKTGKLLKNFACSVGKFRFSVIEIDIVYGSKKNVPVRDVSLYFHIKKIDFLDEGDVK